MRFLFMIIVAIMLVGCSSGDNETPEVNEPNEQADTKSSISVNFRNIEVTMEDFQFHMLGEVNASEDSFYYIIEQGEEVLQEEKKIELDQEGWNDFEIDGELPENVVEQSEPPIILLYGKDKNGELVNPNYIPIDTSMN